MTTVNVYSQQSEEVAPMPQAPTPIVITAPKSVGIAILLTFFFGPLGMLYSTILGAIVMFVLSLLALLLTAGLGLFFTWPTGIIWSALAASSHNKRLLSGVTEGGIVAADSRSSAPSNEMVTPVSLSTPPPAAPFWTDTSSYLSHAQVPDRRLIVAGGLLIVFSIIAGAILYDRGVFSLRVHPASYAASPAPSSQTISTDRPVPQTPERYVGKVAEETVDVFMQEFESSIVLRLRARTEWVPSVRVDVNQNHVIDENVDVSYGRVDATPCFQYLIDERSSTTCAAFRSSASLELLEEQPGMWRSTIWSMPKAELTTADQSAWLVVDAYNLNTQQYIKGSFSTPLLVTFKSLAVQHE